MYILNWDKEGKIYEAPYSCLRDLYAPKESEKLSMNFSGKHFAELKKCETKCFDDLIIAWQIQLALSTESRSDKTHL